MEKQRLAALAEEEKEKKRREAKRLKAETAAKELDAAAAAYDAAEAAAGAAKKAKKEEKEAEAARKVRFQTQADRLKRAKYYCSCKCQSHTEKCRIRHWTGAVLWHGWPDVSREDLKWYLEEKNKSKGSAGALFHCILTVRSGPRRGIDFFC